MVIYNMNDFLFERTFFETDEDGLRILSRDFIVAEMAYGGILLEFDEDGMTQSEWKSLMLPMVESARSTPEAEKSKMQKLTMDALENYTNIIMATTHLGRGPKFIHKTDHELGKIAHILAGIKSQVIGKDSKTGREIVTMFGNDEPFKKLFEKAPAAKTKFVKFVKMTILECLVKAITWGLVDDNGKDGFSFYPKQFCKLIRGCQPYCGNPDCATHTREVLFAPPPALKYCSACKLVGYCSKQCQRADWKRHKGKCKGMTSSTTRHVIETMTGYWAPTADNIAKAQQSEKLAREAKRQTAPTDF